MSTDYLFARDEEATLPPDYVSYGDEAVKADLESAALLRSLIRPLGQESPLQPLALRLSNAENYRIALIPIEDLHQPGMSSPIMATTKPVLVLPLTWKELVVNVQTQRRQEKGTEAEDLVSFGGVTVNFSRMEATRFGESVALTGLHFKIIRYFVRNARRAISREELLNNVWGYNNYPSTRTVDNVVLRLRQTLEPDPSQPVYFRTVHGVGYKFNPWGSSLRD